MIATDHAHNKRGVGTVGFWAIIALVAIAISSVLAVVCVLGCVGFGVVAFMRHREALLAENRLEHEEQVLQYGKVQAARVKELTRRYQHLLLTGNTRIEQYYGEIYTQAEQVLAKAERKRELASSVERRIYGISERFVEDHRKWSTQKLRSDPENYQRRKNELTKAFDFVESVGLRQAGALQKSIGSSTRGRSVKTFTPQSLLFNT